MEKLYKDKGFNKFKKGEKTQMYLPRFFTMQKKLDERIEEKKGLQERDLLEQRVLALQVEIAEMANELPETFKFWSNKKNNYKKALEEYVDCFHFILSIGLELKFTNIEIKDLTSIETRGITKQINLLFKNVIDVNIHRDSKYHYECLVANFLKLGEILGFTTEQVETAYLEKNKINFERQESDY